MDFFICQIENTQSNLQLEELSMTSPHTPYFVIWKDMDWIAGLFMDKELVGWLHPEHSGQQSDVQMGSG